MRPDRLLDRVRATGLLPAREPVAVLLSGGRDSVCLLDVAVRAGARVDALHVNYGLRAEADGDEAHCAALCEALGVALEVLRPGPPRGNVQAWAREVRYAHALGRGTPVAAGHTATDQAETVLHRLAASPGRRALLGMAARDGRLVRPLLDFTRADTAAYCRARGLEWREDASNADETLYTRARVRGRLVPALRSLHPAAEANVVRTARLLRDEAEVLDAVVDGVLVGGEAIEVARLAALPPALGRLVARRLAGDAAAAASRLEEILALPATGSASLDLGGGLRAVVEYGVLRFADAPPPGAPPPTALPVPGHARFGGWEVAARTTPPAPAPDRLDLDSLGGPLTVRAWRPGDRVGSRSLGDLFTDRKVPREARRAIPVIEAGGEIAWVPGVAMGPRFAIGPQSERAVELTATAPR